MAKVKVEVQGDHLKRLAARSTPLKAVAELIWNALDGDATEIKVEVRLNPINGVESVVVDDNGHGVDYNLALKAFKHLGNSWKKGKKSPLGRPLHGEKGEGRFAAFAIGSRVRWSTRYRSEDEYLQYGIVGKDSELGVFDFDDPEPMRNRRTGTEVEISNIDCIPKSLLADDASLKLAEQFAVYLRKHLDVRIWFDGSRVDPAAVQSHIEEYELGPLVMETRRDVMGKLTVIEWRHKVSPRELVLCDEEGCTLTTQKIGVHAPGFQFTAYLNSSFLRENQSVLQVRELHPDLTRLLEVTREKLREHFRKRSAEQAQSLVDQWKKEDVYPYRGVPANPIEVAERQVFDVVALSVNEYLPDFAGGDPRTKRFSMEMLKAAIEQSPSEVRRIVQEVLELSKEKREELIELLDRTSLASVINASKLIVNRLDFLEGLEVILFHYEVKKKTKERKQLHRLLAENTWVFGEEFHLTVDDQGLTEVLRQHLKHVGRNPDEDLAPVTRIDGSRGIVDLMLAKRIRLPKGNEYEHLVIELKRPTKVLDSEVIKQIKNYALAVSQDERFKSSRVKWTFWAISNKMNDYAEADARQRDKPPGLVLDRGNYTIWLKTWNEILDECKGRLRFYQEKLEYMASHEDGIEYLKKVHARFMPEVGDFTADSKNDE